LLDSLTSVYTSLLLLLPSSLLLSLHLLFLLQAPSLPSLEKKSRKKEHTSLSSTVAAGAGAGAGAAGAGAAAVVVAAAVAMRRHFPYTRLEFLARLLFLLTVIVIMKRWRERWRRRRSGRRRRQ